MRTAILLLLLLGFALFTGCYSQRAMLYQRGVSDLRNIKAIAARDGLRLWPMADATYLGLVAEPAISGAKGTIVVFHGNAGAAVHRSYYVGPLAELGYRVVLAEYPGYGGRPGEMTEKSFTKDAVAVLKRVRQEFGGPVYAWGESLGSGVVAAAAGADASAADGLILLTPWDSLLNEARAHYWFLPVRLLLRDKYDSVANLAKYRGPVAVVLAEEDEVIPNRLGRQLYDSLKGPKRLWVMEGVGHNDWLASASNAMWREIMAYCAAPPAK